MRAAHQRPGIRLALCAAAAALGGCGLEVKSADLFSLTRTGQGRSLRLLVSDGGTVRCNGASAKPLPDPLLLDARQLADDLDRDARAHLHLAGAAGSVFSYTMRLKNGSIAFADTAAAAHNELARAEQFALNAAHGPCGLTP